MSATDPAVADADPREPTMAVAAVEWPTVALSLFVYGGWLVLTQAYGDWPSWLVVPSTAVLLTLHSSMQHEVLHGHPTRSVAVNRLFGMWPLSLWIPYDRFRVLHLVHHDNSRLTDPIDDPESSYWTPQAWQELSAFQRRMIELQLTLAGRMLIGSWWRIGHFWALEARAAARGDPGVRGAWLLHLLLCVPVVYWVTVACGIPLWVYLLAMVIPGNGLLLVRSFAEHRARAQVPERTTTVEGSRILGPLFLYNNLHALHHAEPGLPWYRYNSRYRVRREQLAAQNGHQVYSTYFDVARRFLFTLHDQPRHPLGRAPLPRAE
jgi:fatty acid desaturase